MGDEQEQEKGRQTPLYTDQDVVLRVLSASVVENNGPLRNESILSELALEKALGILDMHALARLMTLFDRQMEG